MSERPDGWPEMFSDIQGHCAHQYHWDDSDGLYRCLYCEDTRDAPK